MLKFADIVREQSIMILLAHINNTLPDPIANMFKYEEISNTRQSKHFVIPRARNNYRQFSLSCSASKIWSTLVGKCTSTLAPRNKEQINAKKHVRKYIINEYRELTEWFQCAEIGPFIFSWSMPSSFIIVPTPSLHTIISSLFYCSSIFCFSASFFEAFLWFGHQIKWIYIWM